MLRPIDRQILEKSLDIIGDRVVQWGDDGRGNVDDIGDKLAMMMKYIYEYTFNARKTRH